MPNSLNGGGRNSSCQLVGFGEVRPSFVGSLKKKEPREATGDTRWLRVPDLADVPALISLRGGAAVGGGLSGAPGF